MNENATVRVLLVSGDEALLDLLSDALRLLGHVPHSAPTAAAALDRLARAEVSVVVLDLALPEAGRPELLGRVAEEDLAAEWIALVQGGDKARALQALRLGAGDALATPPDLDEFGVRVAKAAERAAVRRELVSLRKRVERSIMAPGAFALPEGLTLKELELQYIESVLRENDGHRGKTAKILGIDPKTLYNKLGPEHPRKKEPAPPAE